MKTIRQPQAQVKSLLALIQENDMRSFRILEELNGKLEQGSELTPADFESFSTLSEVAMLNLARDVNSPLHKYIIKLAREYEVDIDSFPSVEKPIDDSVVVKHISAEFLKGSKLVPPLSYSLKPDIVTPLSRFFLLYVPVFQYQKMFQNENNRYINPKKSFPIALSFSNQNEFADFCVIPNQSRLTDRYKRKLRESQGISPVQAFIEATDFDPNKLTIMPIVKYGMNFFRWHHLLSFCCDGQVFIIDSFPRYDGKGIYKMDRGNPIAVFNNDFFPDLPVKVLTAGKGLQKDYSMTCPEWTVAFSLAVSKFTKEAKMSGDNRKTSEIIEANLDDILSYSSYVLSIILDRKQQFVLTPTGDGNFVFSINPNYQNSRGYVNPDAVQKVTKTQEISKIKNGINSFKSGLRDFIMKNFELELITKVCVAVEGVEEYDPIVIRGMPKITVEKILEQAPIDAYAILLKMFYQHNKGQKNIELVSQLADCCDSISLWNNTLPPNASFAPYPDRFLNISPKVENLSFIQGDKITIADEEARISEERSGSQSQDSSRANSDSEDLVPNSSSEGHPNSNAEESTPQTAHLIRHSTGSEISDKDFNIPAPNSVQNPVSEATAPEPSIPRGCTRRNQVERPRPIATKFKRDVKGNLIEESVNPTQQVRRAPF